MARTASLASTSALAAALALAGCASAPPPRPAPPPPRPAATPPPPPAPALTIAGTLEPAAGRRVPPRARVRVLWSVTGNGPEHLYAYGEGASEGERFRVALPAAPPAEALNDQGTYGVAVLVLLPDGAGVPDGRVDRAAWTTIAARALGAAGRAAVFYRRGAPARPEWLREFPEGYGCGLGAPPRPGERHERFAPAACDRVTITVDAIRNVRFVDWR